MLLRMMYQLLKSDEIILINGDTSLRMFSQPSVMQVLNISDSRTFRNDSGPDC